MPNLFAIWNARYHDPDKNDPIDYINALQYEVITSYAKKCELMMQHGRFKALHQEKVMITFTYPVDTPQRDLILAAHNLMQRSDIGFSLKALNITTDGDDIHAYFKINTFYAGS